MPFESEKQRRFMWSQHPDIARRWTDKYGSTPTKHSVKALLSSRRKNHAKSAKSK